MKQISDALYDRLMGMAKEFQDDSDDFDLYGCCGGNIDDAYSLGCDEGEIMLAKEIIEDINNLEKTNEDI